MIGQPNTLRRHESGQLLGGADRVFQMITPKAIPETISASESYTPRISGLVHDSVVPTRAQKTTKELLSKVITVTKRLLRSTALKNSASPSTP